MARGEPNFEFEIASEGVHPRTVDAVALLGYVTAYFSALKQIALLSDGDLNFEGIEIVDKCIAIRSRANNADLSWIAVEQLDRFVAGTIAAPRKYSVTTRVRAVIAQRARFLSRLPPAIRASTRTIVRVEGRVSELRAPRDDRPSNFSYRSLETIRAQVERLAGEKLKARLRPVLGQPFTVELSNKELALEVRHHWLDEVDVDVEVERNLGGEIVKGKLLRFHPLQNEGGVAAWRTWAQENAPEIIPDEVE